MLFSQEIAVANISVKLSTNQSSINEYIKKNYIKSFVASNYKIHILSHNSIEDLQIYIRQKHNIIISRCDSIFENIETRTIGNSFIVRILYHNSADIHYCNDKKNDIMELVQSTIEYTIFDFLPENCLILHASMVEYKGSAIVFSGKSGAGKTTMALISHEQGANIVENEHTVFQLNGDLNVYNTSLDVRIKENVKKETNSIIDYNNIIVSPCKNHYKSLIIVFLEFGVKSMLNLSRNEGIGNFLGNIIHSRRRDSVRMIENIKTLISYNEIKLMKAYIEIKNYTSSKEIVKKLFKELDYENNKI